MRTRASARDERIKPLRRVSAWLLIGLLACCAIPAVAAEGCPTSKDEIATDRPDVTNSSLVVPTGSFQSENGINLSGRNGATILDGTSSRLRLGVAPCLEVLVDGPTYFAVLSGEANSGATNVTPAIKWQSSAGKNRPLRSGRRRPISSAWDIHSGLMACSEEPPPGSDRPDDIKECADRNSRRVPS